MNAASERELWELVQAGVAAAQCDALEELGRRGIPDVVPVAVRLLAAPYEEVVLTACRVLSQMGDVQDSTRTGALVALLEDVRELVRTSAAEALGTLRVRSAVPALTRHLRDDPEWIVRASAAEALRGIGDPSCASVLVWVMQNDEIAPVRAYAADALGFVGDAATTRVLAQASQRENDPAVQASLSGARLRLGDGDAFVALLNAIAQIDDINDMGVIGQVRDLLSVRTPRSVVERRGELNDALRATAARVPAVSRDVETVIGLTGEAS